MLYNDTRVIKRTLWALEKKRKNIIHQGGTSSGKTFGVLYALMTYLLHDRNGDKKKGDKLVCSIVSENLPHLKRGALRDFKTIIAELGLTKVIKFNKTDKVFTLPSGTIIEFFAVDNEEKAKSGKRDILFVNECNSVEWMIFWQLSIRTKETVILDYNPSAEFWLHTDYLPTLEKDDYLFTRTTYLDNPALPEEQIRAIEQIKDEYLAKVYKEGKTGIQKGLIFTNVRYVDRMPDQLKKEGYSLDYGYTVDPTAAVHAGIYQGEIYAEELFYETYLLNSDIIRLLKKHGVTKKDRIIADSAEPKSNDEIKLKGGFNIIPVKKGKDSLEFGIDQLKQYRINIVKTSVNARSEAKKYKRDDKGKPIDKHNHFFDALRYWAMENLPAKRKGKIRAIGKKRKHHY